MLEYWVRRHEFVSYKFRTEPKLKSDHHFYTHYSILPKFHYSNFTAMHQNRQHFEMVTDKARFRGPVSIFLFRG